MKLLCFIAVFALLPAGCTGWKSAANSSRVKAAANPELAEELARMVECDKNGKAEKRAADYAHRQSSQAFRAIAVSAIRSLAVVERQVRWQHW